MATKHVKSPPTIRLQSGWMLRTSSSQISEQDCQGGTGVVGDLCEVSHPVCQIALGIHIMCKGRRRRNRNPPRSFCTPHNLIFDSSHSYGDRNGANQLKITVLEK